MSRLIPLLLYLQAVWSTLVVPCTHPDNWKACTSDWDVWLYPELVRGWELYARETLPYQEESDILETWTEENSQNH